MCITFSFLVELIFYIYLQYLVDVPPNYYFDFGAQVSTQSDDSSKDLTPLNIQNISVNITVGQLLNETNATVWLKGVWRNPFAQGNYTKIFPIARISNWQNGIS